MRNAALASLPVLLAACSEVGRPTESGALQPSAVAEASGPIPIYPGTSIQKKVNAYPPGTRFLLKAGTHRRQTVVPKPGNAFIGERGSGGARLAILDGEHAIAYAFHLGEEAPYPNNVRIEGLVIERYAPRLQMGAITAGGRRRHQLTTGWVVEDCEIRHNAAAGVHFGHRSKLLRNRIHHNGQIGIVGRGDSVLVEGNEIAYNNYQKRYNFGWEAGGTKFSRTRWLVVRNNFVHHNWGSGLWTDVDNNRTLYDGNRVEDNAAQGIFHEISYRAVIRNNQIRRNGGARTGNWLYGAGILVAHSPDVEIYGNIVADNANGIAAIQQDRGTGPWGPHEVRNLNVHDNTVTMRSGRTGVGQDIGDNTVFTSRNNRFHNNTYHLGQNSTPFMWMNGGRTPAEWRRYGQDLSGTFDR